LWDNEVDAAQDLDFVRRRGDGAGQIDDFDDGDEGKVGAQNGGTPVGYLS